MFMILDHGLNVQTIIKHKNQRICELGLKRNEHSIGNVSFDSTLIIQSTSHSTKTNHRECLPPRFHNFKISAQHLKVILTLQCIIDFSLFETFTPTLFLCCNFHH